MLALIVDDSKVVRTVSGKILEQLDVSYNEAENGQKALELCSQNKYDFILLDWNMPVMSGLEFILEFRKNSENALTPVIFCTTENEVDKITQAITSGASEYIMKPFDYEIVKSKLEQLGII
jgi:two-component system chemotaxis response regulator CheY